jgi:putative transcriptional regulator
MTPNHHPEPDTLMAYAAGTLPNVISCVVSCHLSLCRECAGHVSWLSKVGGVLLEKVEAAPAAPGVMESAAARWLADGRTAPDTDRNPEPQGSDPVLPKPLARYLGMSVDQVPWKTVVKGVRQHWVKLPRETGTIRLLRLTPGKELLEHTHTGMELTMVLQGVYGDHTGEYRRGDIIEWTEGTLHQPRAGGDVECICMIGSENTPYFSRLIARLLRPIMGF